MQCPHLQPRINGRACSCRSMLIKSSPPVTQFTCFCNFLSLLHFSHGLFTVTQLLSRNVTLAPRKTQKSSVTHSFQGLCFLELNLGVATEASHPCFFSRTPRKMIRFCRCRSQNSGHAMLPRFWPLLLLLQL